MYKKFYLLLFFFFYYDMWSDGEGRGCVNLHTHRGDGEVFMWNYSVFLLRSPFAKLVQDQLKTSTHLSFYIFSTLEPSSLFGDYTRF